MTAGAGAGPTTARPWTAIAVGTGVVVLLVVLAAAGDGIQVLPDEVVGRRDDGGAVWLLLALVLAVGLGPALAYLSGRRTWALTGGAALVAGVAVAVILGNAFPALASGVTVTATIVLGVLGAIALQHRSRAQLVARAVAVVALVALSWSLTASGVLDPTPLVTFAVLGAADAVASRARTA